MFFSPTFVASTIFNIIVCYCYALTRSLRESLNDGKSATRRSKNLAIFWTIFYCMNSASGNQLSGVKYMNIVIFWFKESKITNYCWFLSNWGLFYFACSPYEAPKFLWSRSRTNSTLGKTLKCTIISRIICVKSASTNILPLFRENRPLNVWIWMLTVYLLVPSCYWFSSYYWHENSNGSSVFASIGKHLEKVSIFGKTCTVGGVARAHKQKRHFWLVVFPYIELSF